MFEDSKLVEPLSTVVSVVLRLVIGVLAVGLVLSLFGDDIHFFGWGSADTCVSADWMSSTISGTDTAFRAKAGAQVGAIPQYCTEHPGTYQSTLALLGALPRFLLMVGGLLILSRLLTAASRNGVYTSQTARRLQVLGWWLLLGSLITQLIEANAKAALLATLTDTVPFHADSWLNVWATPYLAILTALGLLTFARIMRAGATMRDDLEGTV